MFQYMFKDMFTDMHGGKSYLSSEERKIEEAYKNLQDVMKDAQKFSSKSSKFEWFSISNMHEQWCDMKNEGYTFRI